jgi:uncharacterized protein (DUF885 family)
MNQRIAPILLALLATSCGPTGAGVPDHPSPPPATTPQEPEQAAAAVTIERLLRERLAFKPSWGRQVGMHEHDGKVADYSLTGIQRYADWAEAAVTALDAMDEAALSPDERLDRAVLRNQLQADRFWIVDLELYRRNPRAYSELFDVSGYINFDYAPLEQRAKSLLAHERAALAQAPHLLANLHPAVSKPGVETAVKSFKGFATYLRGDVVRIVGGLGDEAFRKEFAATNEKLAAAAEHIAKRLETEWLPRGDDSHVLGRERYLRFVEAQEGRAIALDELERMAEADLARNKAAYQKLSKTVAITRPKATELLAGATRLMEASRRFVLDRKLVTIPSEDRATLEETPPFMRWNAAFLNMPGPYDKAKQAYYYITLPDPKWPAEEQEAYIFPWGTLMATTVHEVYPGHFLHGLWTRNAPTMAQKMIDSYSFTEGWAHYTEQLMVEQGFGRDDPQNHLGQLSDALLRNCRFVVSIGVHAKGMSLERAAERFRDDCMQDKATAREQAVRATFDPGYFAYTLGKLQILELRAEAKKQLGARFDLRRFHDALLSHGAPPVALVRERVLHEIGVR